ncbi:calcium-binding protein [Bradyrhizobium sp. JYMT SZCCT0428]|uniref:calcium-binding protein n=1 Tax=Bradyrhizobium sp. JYMT SZCCT0428 TaxID=2807673 RepID=UPI001BAAECD0|nr:hypothetical protein [Bradyrhizobium sp. JYMT SZCCT0428]
MPVLLKLFAADFWRTPQSRPRASARSEAGRRAAEAPASAKPANDAIYGGQGNDTLFGGNGNDTLVGAVEWMYRWAMVETIIFTLLAAKLLKFTSRRPMGARQRYFDLHRRARHRQGGDGNDTMFGNAGQDIFMVVMTTIICLAVTVLTYS